MAITIAPVTVAVAIHKNARARLGETASESLVCCVEVDEGAVATASVYSTRALAASIKTILNFEALSICDRRGPELRNSYGWQLRFCGGESFGKTVVSG